MTTAYPFTAIIGQEAMQTALLICAVDPSIGGVLVRGQKGTAKSTTARGLAAVLPPIEVVTGCPYHCDPGKTDLLHDACRKHLTEHDELPRTRLGAETGSKNPHPEITGRNLLV